MQRTRRIIAVLALTAALGACDTGDTVIDTDPTGPAPTDQATTVPMPDETTTTVAG